MVSNQLNPAGHRDKVEREERAITLGKSNEGVVEKL